MARANRRKHLQDNSPNITAHCVNRGRCLNFLDLQYVNYREANNHTPAVPQSAAMSEKYLV